jgi:esterase/lipase superfamily enzyme
MAKIRYNSTTPIYLSDGRGRSIEEISTALDEAHAKSTAGDPIVFFVHGRGKEPNKSLRGATWVKGLAVYKIELGYSQRVLMFNWDSKFPGLAWRNRKLPLEGALQATEAIRRTVNAINAYYVTRPTLKRPVLLAHSMGSIVLQRLIEADGWPKANAVFSSVLFSQPDADDVGHSPWVSRLAAIEKVFITFNRDDKVLLKSTDERSEKTHALGLGTTEPLAPNATYIDLSNMVYSGERDDDHEVFGKGAMNGQIYVCGFFQELLKGEVPRISTTDNNVESVVGNVVRFKNKVVLGSPCLKVPELPKFD